MRALRVAMIVAALTCAAPPVQAHASICRLGAWLFGHHGHCHGRCAAPCCQMQCHTVTKLVPKTVYDKQCDTTYKTVYDTTYEMQTLPVIKNVPEIAYKEVPYTYYRPVYENKSRTVYHTVCYPVHEVRSRVVNYTTYYPVHETRTREVPYTTYRTICETHTRTEHYTIPRQVKWTEKVPVETGCWKVVHEERPGPVLTRCVQEPGCWEWDPCRCCCVYKPGPCKEVKVQCPPIKTCRKVWVPRTEYHEVTRCRTEYDRRTREVPYTVHRSLPEVKHHVVNYTVTRMIPQTHSQTLQYTVTRMVPERRESVHHYTVCRQVPEQGVRQVAYTVHRPVQTYKTVAVPRSIPRQIPITVTRLVPRTVYEKVCVKVCVPVPTCCAPSCDAPHHSAAAPAPSVATPPVYGAAAPSYHPPVFPEGPIYGGPSHGIPAAPGLDPSGEFDAFGASPSTQGDSDAKRDFQIAAQDGGRLLAQEIDPQAAQAARERLAAGLRHYWAGRYHEAIETLSSAGEAHPADAKSLYFKALSQLRIEDREAATKTLAEAVAAEKAQPIQDWGKTMERVQGPQRLWLEQGRRALR